MRLLFLLVAIWPSLSLVAYRNDNPCDQFDPGYSPWPDGKQRWLYLPISTSYEPPVFWDGKQMVFFPSEEVTRLRYDGIGVVIAETEEEAKSLAWQKYNEESFGLSDRVTIQILCRIPDTRLSRTAMGLTNGILWDYRLFWRGI